MCVGAERSVSWEQVRAFRLQRQHLLQRVPVGGLVEAVRDVCGVQAQVQSAAELQVWARAEGVKAEDVRRALWEERTLVRTWCMRGTLHLLAADELPMYVGALRTHDRWWKGSWLRLIAKLSADELNAVLDAIGQTLDGTPITREQLADAVARRVGAHARERMLSGWAELLKPAAFRGELIAGPPIGQNVTFVRPDRWLSGWDEPGAAEAWNGIVRCYLRVYGPATREDFARWWGIQPATAGRVLKAASLQLAEVSVAGEPPGLVLKEDREALQVASVSGSIRLLPSFDVYTIGNRPRASLVAPEFEARVFRQAGWVSPIVAVDGLAAGVWDYSVERGRLAVTVEPFRELAAPERAGIAEEAERLGVYLDTPPSVVYTT